MMRRIARLVLPAAGLLAGMGCTDAYAEDRARLIERELSRLQGT